MSYPSIKEPYWTRPTLLDSNRTFPVVLESRSAASPALSLTSVDGDKVSVRIEGSATLRSGLTEYTCTALGAIAGHTYDLELAIDGIDTTVPRAVSALPHDTESLTLLHCSDLHLLKPTPEGTMKDRSTLIAALAARINALHPDLVICTGDLIGRYDAQKRALPAGRIRWQIRRVKELLTQVEVPFFVTVGNHDTAFEETRGDWYAAMGGGWRGGTDDSSLDWGRYHLALMDGFACYDPQNAPLRSSFTAEQIQWLRQDLLAASASQLRLVLAHYDYHKQLPSLLHELRIDLLFYGHSTGLYPKDLAENGVWDGHLAATKAYNLVRLTPRNIESERVSWARLISQDIGSADPTS